jgi:hypothetical protein
VHDPQGATICFSFFHAILPSTQGSHYLNTVAVIHAFFIACIHKDNAQYFDVAYEPLLKL